MNISENVAGIDKWPELCQGAGNINDAWRIWILCVQGNKTIPDQWLQSEADLTPNLLKKLEYPQKQALKMPGICDGIVWSVQRIKQESCTKHSVDNCQEQRALTARNDASGNDWGLCLGECWKHPVIEAIGSDCRSPKLHSWVSTNQIKALNGNSLTVQKGNIPGFSLL